MKEYKLNTKPKFKNPKNPFGKVPVARVTPVTSKYYKKKSREIRKGIL